MDDFERRAEVLAARMDVLGGADAKHGFDAREARTCLEGLLGLLREFRVAADGARRCALVPARQVRFHKLISGVASSFMNLPSAETDRGVREALAAIGNFAEVDRSYVFLFAEEGGALRCAHEWCAKGIEPQIQHLQDLALARFPWFAERIRREEVVHVPRVADLPPEAAAERTEFERQGIRSLLNVPLVCHNRVAGFLGFDAVRSEKAWPEEDLELLRIVGQIIVSALRRQRSDEALRAAKEAAELANSARNDFIGMVSHELKTPLNSIIGYTELLVDEVEGPINENQRRSLTRAQKSARHLLRLVDDILDLSRLEAGRRASGRGMDLQTEDFCLRERLEEAIQALTPRAHEKGLGLCSTVQPGVPDALIGDPDRFRQVLTNLIENAIKFTEYGEVTVLVELEAERIPRPNCICLHFAVKDTGIGIPADKQAAIFKPFVQGDSSATRRYQGIGLGLAISLNLVELMQGRIWVESEVGRGSTFHFTACFGVPATTAPGIVHRHWAQQALPL
jgi:signal transduction histidine kinase